MKPIWIVMLLASVLLAGCGGDNNPVNKGQEKPIPPNNKAKEK